jgi:hypothetical protein
MAPEVAMVTEFARRMLQFDDSEKKIVPGQEGRARSPFIIDAR